MIKPEKFIAKAVIFDMDGLMFDTERLGLLGWHDAGRAFGVEIRDEHIIPFCGLPKPVFIKKLALVLPKGLDVEALYEHKNRYFYELVRQNGVPQKHGLVELLEELKKRGIAAALATSTKRDSALHILEKAGVRQYFSELVCGDEIKNGKPNPDIYLAAARKLNVNPQDCLALEDSPNGALAAIRAGMKTVFVPDLVQAPKEIKMQLYSIAPTLAEVIPLLVGVGDT